MPTRKQRLRRPSVQAWIRPATRAAAVVGLLLASPATGLSCPVDLFREYNPTRPPMILTDPPIRQIDASPYPDPDPEPMGTRLTFYRLNTRVDPDPDVPVLYLIKVADVATLIWTGSRPPGACCVGLACSELCPAECAMAGGLYQGDGTACSDMPPPCGTPGLCNGAGPAFGLAKPSGGGVSFGGVGFPTLLPTDAYIVDTADATTTAAGLTVSPDDQLTWNFTGARDRTNERFYFAGGRYNHASIDATVVTVATSAPVNVANVALLSPEVNLLHVDVDTSDGALYGLAVLGGGLSITGGHVHFPGGLDLVGIDPTTGTVTTIGAGLPGDLEHFAATFDSTNGRYFYHSYSGELHAVAIATGAPTTTSMPEHVVDLQYDDATSSLYGLRPSGPSVFSGSGTEGYRTSFALDLVRIDPMTGTTIVLNGMALPPGTTNWSSAFDCELGHYLYVGATGETHVLDVATGMLLTSAPPPTDGRFHSLD